MGPDLLIALLFLFLGVGVPLWAVIDAANKPAVAFYGAGSNKTAWIAVIVVAFFLGVAFFFGGFYLLFTRPKVHRQMRSPLIEEPPQIDAPMDCQGRVLTLGAEQRLPAPRSA
jgi:RsiW-degrading membrane proteinase PrsW (M82 family)